MSGGEGQTLPNEKRSRMLWRKKVPLKVAVPRATRLGTSERVPSGVLEYVAEKSAECRMSLPQMSYPWTMMW